VSPQASVVVVSRARPAELRRCFLGLSQLDYPNFEIVIVADGAGLSALQGAEAKAKLVRFDEPNIAAARNAGFLHAAGEIVAFIDDDAVPEASWLTRLVAPFAVPEVSAAGGFVRGRNGISWQWRGRFVGRDARETAIADWGQEARLFKAEPGGAVKLQGTNMAFRRDVLAALGAFDRAFRFYLDETDLCLRLAAAGYTVALAPLAEVHHGFAASERRRADRVPLSLADIGRSLAFFLRKHCPLAERDAARAAAREDERRRLLRHMVAGAIEPRDVGRLLAGFEAGLGEGELSPLPPAISLGRAPPAPFLRFRPLPPGHALIVGRRWQRWRLRQKARARAAEGERVTLFLFGPGARRHRMRFTESGYWEQTGGLWGKADRSGPRPRLGGFSARVAEETQRLRPVRPFAPKPADRGA
jgi:GT2 family glycosyltransferase